MPVVGKITASDPAAKCISAVAVYQTEDGSDEPEMIENCTEVRMFADGRVAVGEGSRLQWTNGQHVSVTMRLVPHVKIRWKHAPCRFCFVWRVPKSVEVQQ